MRILLDEQLPRQLAPYFVGHDVRTTQEQGWAGLKNGALLKQALAAGFEVFVTGFEQAGPLPPSNGPRTLQPLAGMTMRQVLELIVGLDPRYTWREVDGVAVVRPSAAWSNQDDALNRRGQNIHWTSVNARQTLDRLTSVIYDAPVAVTPGSVNPRTFAVGIADGTVIQVLNAAAKAGGLFWWTETQKTSSGSEALMVSLAGFDDRGGPVVTWPAQIHVPR